MSPETPSRRRLLGGAALACSLLSCRSRPGEVALDLAHAAPLADRSAASELVVFGAPGAEAYAGAGFFPPGGPDRGDRYDWAAPQAELRFKWAEVEARRALVDLAPHPEVARQSVEVFLNGGRVAGFPLERRRRRYAVALPESAQREGHNTLRFVFEAGSAPQKPYHARLAAALYSLAVGPASDASLDDLTARDAPPPLSLSEDGSRLVQVGPSVLRFALAAPEHAELRFAADLHPLARAAGGAARLRVTLETESAPERELWRGTLGAGDRAPREVALPLGVPAGTLVRVGLHVEGAPAERFAWGVWGAPRLLGDGRLDPLGARPAAPPPRREEPRAAALRRALAGSNVVFILLDAAGARHFSCYGYPRPTTPEIDRIASEGVVFEEAYSPVGFTLLAMSTIWTSQLPDEHHNGVPYNSKLHAGALTLARVLGAAGIHTAAFVDNAFAGTAYGLDQGFAEFDSLYRRFPRAGAEIFPAVVGPWLEAHTGRGFFAYLHFREPHFPYNPPPPYDTLYGPNAPLPREARTELDWLTDVNWKRTAATPAQIDHLVRLYDGNLRYADAQVGELRKRLEAAGLWERSVVIVTADHGDALDEHGFIGHLNQVYQDIVHIPLIVRFPKGTGPAGLRVKAKVDLTDVAPTVTDLFGVTGASGSRRSFRGRSLLDVLSGAPGKDAVVARTAEDQPKYAVRHDRFKYIYYTARGTGELYDVAADPGERNDLAPGRSLRCSFYRQALFRWLLEMRRGPRAVGEEPELSEEDKESLRALGYVHE